MFRSRHAHAVFPWLFAAVAAAAACGGSSVSAGSGEAAGPVAPSGDAAATADADAPYDLVIVHAGAVLGAPASVDAVAVRADRIASIGDTASIAPRCTGACVVVDAAHGFVSPGFHDAHVHLAIAAGEEGEVVVSGASVPAIVAAVRAHAAAHPELAWIRGHGWSLAAFGGALPTKSALDAVSTTRPIVLGDTSLHNAWVNSAALAAAHIDASTPDPVGGRIVRDASGAPTGILLDAAMLRMQAAIPPATDADMQASLLTEHAKSLRAGYTSVGGGPLTWQQAQAYAALDAAGKLEQRVFGWARLDVDDAGFQTWVSFARGLPKGGKFHIVAFKGFMDGTLGAHTGALLAPYADDPSTDGGPMAHSPQGLAQLVARANAAGFPVALHAIGDRAVRGALDAFEAAQRASGAPLAMPNRVEHANLVDPADLPRFHALGVVASMQPSFSYFASASTIGYAPFVGPERLSAMLPWRSLADTGALLAFGTDFPVGHLGEDPITSLFSATHRQCMNGDPFPGPAEILPPGAAVDAATWNPASAVGMGAELGRVQVGYLADLVVLDADPRTSAARSLAANHVRAVVAGGKLRAP